VNYSELRLAKAAERRRVFHTIVPGVFPKGARIMFLGQAPGLVECRKGEPFVGPSGQELQDWCRVAGIKWSECARTNVFNEPLPDGGLEAITRAKTHDERLPPIGKGMYLIPEWQHHIDRLVQEVTVARPNVIVALGGEALWVLKGTYEITKNRGSMFMSGVGIKALATFHPSYVLRLGRKPRNLCIVDLLKALNNSRTTELKTMRRQLWINPSIHDLHEFKAHHIDLASLLFLDIENDYPKSKTDTKWLRQITHFGVATSPYAALSLPLSFKAKSYWPTAQEELEAVKWIKAVCESQTPKALQNGLHDIRWLWDAYRIRVRNYCHDLRLLHHALFPELPKSLGFMGSVWTDELAWKLLGGGNKGDD